MGIKILFCWLGATDLKASAGDMHIALGPVAQAAEARTYGEVVLLNNWDRTSTENYVAWLRQKTSAQIIIQQIALTSPTNFGEIYQASSRIIAEKLQVYGPSTDLVFHLSPGTPAMAAVWIHNLAKTPPSPPNSYRIFPANKGSGSASVPFDISAEFIPDLVAEAPDREASKNSLRPDFLADCSGIRPAYVYR